MTEVNIPDTVLEEFRCSICKHYLSCVPVQILPNGNNVCNLCSLSTEQPTYRQLTMEALLRKLSFPCRFKNYGCEERVPFGQVDNHEENCTYHDYICPTLSTCVWKGSAEQIIEHFTKKHANLIKENAEFKLQVDQNEDEIFIFALDGVHFIVKYVYIATTSDLKYDVRFLTNIQEAMYKTRLTNDSECDYNTNMKGGNIVPYNHNFYSLLDTKTIILNNYMQVLDNPNCITVTINAAVVTKGKQEDASAEQRIVNRALLQSLQCGKCRGYIIPPLYDSRFSPLCCQEKFKCTKPLFNNELIERVTKLNFPCRWRRCKFVDKPKNLLNHHPGCQFRTFNCRDCEDTFTWTDAIYHLESHGHTYFTDKFVYKMAFNKLYLHTKNFAFKNNEIIFVGHETSAKNKIHTIDSHYTGSCSSSIKVEFKHAHCGTKSVFALYNVKFLTLDYLPDCFKHNQILTVTVTIS